MEHLLREQNRLLSAISDPKVHEAFGRITGAASPLVPGGEVALKTGVSTLEWAADKMIRAETALSSAIGALPGPARAIYGSPLLGTLEELHVGRLSKSKRERHLEERGVLKAFVDGLKLDPGAASVGQLVIPDEYSDYEFPILHRAFGLKLGHLRLPADILYSPLTYITGGTGRAVRAAGTTGKRIALSPKATSRFTVFGERAMRRVKPIVKRRMELAKAQGKLAPPKWMDDWDAFVEQEAYIASRRATSRMQQRLVDRWIKSGDKALREPSGLRFFGQLIVPSEPLANQFRSVWQRIPGRGTIEQIARGVSDPFDDLLNEVQRPVRKMWPRFSQALSERRALTSTIDSNAGRWLDQLFKGVPKATREDIGRYMGLRRTRPAVAKEAFERIPEEHRHLIDELDDVASRIQLTEHYAGVPYDDLPGYFPNRYDISEEAVDQIMARRQIAHGVEDPRTVAMTSGQFRYHRQYDDMLQAVEEARALGVKDGPKPIWDAKRAWRMRLHEHARVMGARHFASEVIRMSTSGKDLWKRVFAQRFPELNDELFDTLRRNYDEYVKEAGESSDDIVRKLLNEDADTRGERFGRVGKAIHLDETIRGRAEVNLTKKVKKTRGTSKLQKDLDAAIDNMSPEETALFLEGVVRNTGDAEGLEHALKLYSHLLDELDPDLYNRVRAALGQSRAHMVDQFDQPLVQVKGIPTAPELDGMWLPKSVADELISRKTVLPRGVKRALKVWDVFLIPFKLGVTVLWLPFHVRNFYSDVAQAFTEIGLAGLNPRKWRDTVNIVFGRDGAMKIRGANVPYQHEQELMRRLGVLQSPRTISDVFDVEGVPRRILDTKAGRSVLKIGTARENMGRAQLYVHYRSQGYAPEMAAAFVNNVFFDYGALSSAEKNVFRRIFPFWTWNKKNVALQARQLARNPGRLSAQVHIGMQDYGPDESFLPEYAQGLFKIGWHVDEKVKFLTGVDLPIQSAVDLTWPGEVTGALTNWASMMHPALKNPIEVYVAKRNFFTGKEINSHTRYYLRGQGGIIGAWPKAIGGDALRALLDYREEVDPETGERFFTVNEAKFHIFIRGSLISRFSATENRMQGYLDEEGLASWQSLVDLIGGFRLREYDLSDRQKAIVRSNIRKLRKQGLENTDLYEFKVYGKSRRERVR